MSKDSLSDFNKRVAVSTCNPFIADDKPFGSVATVSAKSFVVFKKAIFWASIFIESKEATKALIDTTDIAEKDIITIIYGKDVEESEVEELSQYIEEKFPGYKVKRGIIPINVCAHCGPGTIGILISKKVNGKALNEYL